MNRNRIIDGKNLAEKLQKKIKKTTTRLQKEYGLVPGLATVIVGEDPASKIYVQNKNKAAVNAGMNSQTKSMPKETTERQLLSMISSLNEDSEIHGILVQLPLPSHINPNIIINSIDPLKDVDGFHVRNVGLLNTSQSGIVACTPQACLALIKSRMPDLTGLTAVVAGRSNIVGKPLAQLLLSENCTVTIAHSHTKTLPDLCLTADILVAAMGRPEIVRGDWIKPGSIVIDVGINRIKSKTNGKSFLVGDVAFDEAVERAYAITPVPGGVGPMTIACLLKNTLTLVCKQKKIEPIF